MKKGLLVLLGSLLLLTIVGCDSQLEDDLVGSWTLESAEHYLSTYDVTFDDDNMYKFEINAHSASAGVTGEGSKTWSVEDEKLELVGALGIVSCSFDVSSDKVTINDFYSYYLDTKDNNTIKTLHYGKVVLKKVN